LLQSQPTKQQSTGCSSLQQTELVPDCQQGSGWCWSCWDLLLLLLLCSLVGRHQLLLLLLLCNKQQGRPAAAAAAALLLRWFLCFCAQSCRELEAPLAEAALNPSPFYLNLAMLAR
jgi:hypothetical protein